MSTFLEVRVCQGSDRAHESHDKSGVGIVTKRKTAWKNDYSNVRDQECEHQGQPLMILRIANVDVCSLFSGPCRWDNVAMWEEYLSPYHGTLPHGEQPFFRDVSS